MTDSPLPTPPKPGRRRFALSLRALMLLVLVVGGGMGWKARRASIQRRAVAEIKAAGGTVWYDYQFQGGTWVPTAPPWAPAWLRGAIGDEYFQEPAGIFLDGPVAAGPGQSDDETLEAVARLDGVRFLHTTGIEFGDAGFARLATMPRLEDVTLGDVVVTDRGLAAVERFPAVTQLRLRFAGGGVTGKALEPVARQGGITFLELEYGDFTDPAALAPLARMTRLGHLKLSRSPADDACLEALRGLAALKTIDLRDTKLTDAGVARLRSPAWLAFDGSKLTDAGLARLGEHRGLVRLHLDPAPLVTDAGLAALDRLRLLVDLQLPGSNVTDAGLARLQGLKLATLDVSGAGVTDAGLARLAASCSFFELTLKQTGVVGPGLARHAGLRSLVLDGSKVDDAGAAVLATLRRLRGVSLRDTAVGDAGLLAIVRGCPLLDFLDVSGTKVTAAGVASAKRLKPGLGLQFEP